MWGGGGVGGVKKYGFKGRSRRKNNIGCKVFFCGGWSPIKSFKFFWILDQGCY